MLNKFQLDVSEFQRITRIIYLMTYTEARHFLKKSPTMRNPYLDLAKALDIPIVARNPDRIMRDIWSYLQENHPQEPHIDACDVPKRPKEETL